MRYIKLFESFKDIDNICDMLGIYNYTINSDGSIDVDDDVLLGRKSDKMLLKFGNITRGFNCNGIGLKSLGRWS